MHQLNTMYLKYLKFTFKWIFKWIFIITIAKYKHYREKTQKTFNSLSKLKIDELSLFAKWLTFKTYGIEKRPKLIIECRQYFINFLAHFLEQIRINLFETKARKPSTNWKKFNFQQISIQALQNKKHHTFRKFFSNFSIWKLSTLNTINQTSSWFFNKQLCNFVHFLCSLASLLAFLLWVLACFTGFANLELIWCFYWVL